METALQFKAMSYFRSRRNAPLNALIETLRQPVTVLDIGGTHHFWSTVDSAGRCRITLLNLDQGDVIADARNLPYADDSFDLVVSNSLIEHVGQWADIKAACAEIRRVGKRGWVQTPSPMFPIEPHLLLPFIHWLSPDLQRAVLRYVPAKGIRTRQPGEIREVLERTSLISKAELRELFPGCAIHTEWFLFPKSHIVTWG